MVTLIEDEQEKVDICREVLSALPDWFGNGDSLKQYAENCRKLPLWAAKDPLGVQGFIAFRATAPRAGEVHVMGVCPKSHRKGLGRELFAALYDYAAREKYRFLTVKTVRMGEYESYDRTNLFYKSLGFLELECLPELWDEANPCQIYIMDVIA